MAERLAGKVGVVTGGGHGIGIHYGRALAEEGASVLLADIDREAVEKVAAELAADGHDTAPGHCDISDERSVASLFEQVQSRWGKLDVLVNNAAIFKSVPMTIGRSEDLAVDEFDRMLRVNVLGTWIMCRAAASMMRPNGYGKIINISSTLGMRAPAGRGTFTHYGASKAGVISVTQWMARELGSEGVRVNAIAPGGTASSPDEDLSAHTASVAERAIQRVQRPEDLLGPMLFLATPDSDFVTGQTIVVDGGQFMR